MVKKAFGPLERASFNLLLQWHKSQNFIFEPNHYLQSFTRGIVGLVTTFSTKKYVSRKRDWLLVAITANLNMVRVLVEANMYKTTKHFTYTSGNKKGNEWEIKLRNGKGHCTFSLVAYIKSVSDVVIYTQHNISIYLQWAHKAECTQSQKCEKNCYTWIYFCAFHWRKL